MNRPRAALRIRMAGLGLVVLAIGCGQRTQPSEVQTSTEPPPASMSGLELYVTYCQGCHGPEGRGDGPVAPLLTTPPADLTTLIMRYGEFPTELVANTIDGRAQVQGHGSREMPVWGNVWNDPADSVAEERIRAQIALLVTFLQSVQVDSTGT